MLYKIKPNGTTTELVPLKATTMTAQGLTEKVVEEWLAANPHVVVPSDERLLVIHQAKAFQNLTDILAVDAEGNLVVIEVKRGQTPRDVIAQAVEYASDVEGWDYSELNALATGYFKKRDQPFGSLLEAYQQMFAVEPDEFAETQFNARQRVLIVGEAIEAKVERTARWLLRRGVDIGCLSYQCYRSDDDELFLDFVEVVRPEEPPKPGSLGQAATPSVETAVRKMTPAASDLFTNLRDRVLQFGPDVEVGATAAYLKFVAANNFAEIHPRKAGLKVFVRPEGLNLPENGNAVVEGVAVHRVSDKFLWTLNHTFDVKSAGDLEGAEHLLRRSYQAVSNGA